MNVEFKFGLKQTVTMTVSSVSGTVTALWFDMDEIKWTQVHYVDANQNIQHEWVRESELQAA